MIKNIEMKDVPVEMRHKIIQAMENNEFEFVNYKLRKKVYVNRNYKIILYGYSKILQRILIVEVFDCDTTV